MTRELALTSEKPQRQEPRYDGASDHAVRLRGDEHAERGRVQLDAAGRDGAREDQGQQGAGQHRARHRGAAAVREAVQEGADDGGEEGERRHGDGEIERDAAAGLVGRHREEDGGGEGDGDHDVAGAVHRVQFDELAEARLARPVGVGDLADAAGRAGEREVQGAAQRAGGPPRRARRDGSYGHRPGGGHPVIVPCWGAASANTGCEPWRTSPPLRGGALSPVARRGGRRAGSPRRAGWSASPLRGGGAHPPARLPRDVGWAYGAFRSPAPRGWCASPLRGGFPARPPVCPATWGGRTAPFARAPPGWSASPVRGRGRRPPTRLLRDACLFRLATRLRGV